jgi:hypothetical protein
MDQREVSRVVRQVLAADCQCEETVLTWAWSRSLVQRIGQAADDTRIRLTRSWSQWASG